jgi:peptide/nickel transport system permease protein
MLSLPIILIALLFAVTLGPSFSNLIIVLGLVMWARFARLARGEVLTWKEREFVALARVAGCSAQRILLRHILPNIINPLVVLGTLQIGWVIIVESSLSFLGAGIPPPTPSWGGMIAGGRAYLTTAWWLSVFPGIALVVVVLSVNLLGDWLRDYMDPRMRNLR